MEVGADDDVHGRGLSNLVLVKAAVLVRLENQWAHGSQDSLLLVSNRDEVDSFSGEGVHSTLVDTSDALKNEVAKLLGVVQISIVNQLHEEKHIHEDLTLGNLSDLGGSLVSGVQLLFGGLTCFEFSGLAR